MVANYIEKLELVNMAVTKYIRKLLYFLTNILMPQVKGGQFSLLHNIQIGSGSHSASYPTDIWGSITGGNAAEA